MSAVLAALPPARASELQEVYRLTHQLTAAVEVANWELAGELDRCRSQQLQELFARPLAPGELPAVAAALRDLLRLNDAAIGLVQHQARATEREAALSAGRHVAVCQYLECAR
jgi:hypothetical protein